MLRSILADRGLTATAGAEIQIPLLGEGSNGSAVAAMVAGCPAVSFINAVLKHQNLIKGCDIFLLRQIALIQHFAQNAFLTVAVTLLTIAHFALVHIDTGGVWVEQRGVIGDADKAGAFGNGQALQFLAEIGSSSGLDTIAAFAQINTIQIFLHDNIFVVFLFQQLRPENLHHLSLHGDALFIGGVFHQLLGDGGAAKLGVTAEKHIGTGFDSGNPVNALVLVKALVFNGNRGIYQRLRNFIPSSRLTIGGSVNLLEQLNIAVTVYIMDIGCFFNIVVLIRPVLCLLQDVVLKVFCQRPHKNEAADNTDQQHRCRSAQRNFEDGKKRGTSCVHKLYCPMRIPLLPDFLSPPMILILTCHR